MGKWGKWALLLVVAMAFAVPVWAIDLSLGGKYDILRADIILIRILSKPMQRAITPTRSPPRT